MERSVRHSTWWQSQAANAGMKLAVVDPSGRVVSSAGHWRRCDRAYRRGIQDPTIYHAYIFRCQLKEYFSIHNFLDAVKTGLGIKSRRVPFIIYQMWFSAKAAPVSRFVAARMLRIPIFVRESGPVPSRTNCGASNSPLAYRFSVEAGAYFERRKTAYTSTGEKEILTPLSNGACEC